MKRFVDFLADNPDFGCFVVMCGLFAALAGAGSVIGLILRPFI